MAGGHTRPNELDQDLTGRRFKELVKSEWVAKWLTVLVWVGVAISFLAINTFPVITNDSVLYLRHSGDILGGGWVEYGYRQVGYPLFLSGIRVLADVFGAEPLLAVAVVQRGLLLLGVVLAWRFWRWWSLPLIALLASAETIAYTNFVLTEGLAVPLAVLLVFPTVRFLELVVHQTSESSIRAILLASLIVGIVLLIYGLRFTYAVFGAVPLVLAIAGWVAGHRRLAVGIVGATVILMGLFAVLVSLENRTEEGVFGPSVSGDPTRYYYAWHRVFTIDPDSQVDPELSEFYDDGAVHAFSREVDSLGLTREEKQSAYDAEIESMLEKAGVPVFGSKVESTIFGLAGGRLHDIRRAVADVVRSTRHTVDDFIFRNAFARSNGPEAFVAEFNDGQPIDAVITDPIGIPAPVPHTATMVFYMLPLAMVLMLIGLVSKHTRSLSALGVLVVVAFAAGMGWIRAENLRFLMATSAFGITTATAGIWTYANTRPPRNGDTGTKSPELASEND